MLTLNDGRSELWQWDTGRTLSVDADCSQVHFSNKVFGRSIDVDVVDGVAIIPDILLQTDKELNVWAFVGTAENGYTKISKTFKVNRRNKPADYVFTPVEQTTITEIAAIAQSVRDDADAGLFDGKPGENGRDGVDGKDGAPGKDGTSATHSWNGTVLTITSASGTSSSDLKGDKGDKGEQGERGIPGPSGEPGAPGHTPEYGVDYGTPDQISGIAQQASDILQPDVNQLKEDLATKIDKPSTAPAVGKILKVTAVNGDGTFVCEWADAPSGGVTDVKIVDKSIVEDRIATIPEAGYDKYGVIPLFSQTYSGLIIKNNAGHRTLMLFSAPNNYIKERIYYSVCPITVTNYDFAVKTAMCDGKGMAWTDTERIAALLRMGCTVDDNGFVKWTAQEVSE